MPRLVKKIPANSIQDAIDNLCVPEATNIKAELMPNRKTHIFKGYYRVSFDLPKDWRKK